ncbi:hypothetical protein OPT61_g10718 [Boeremia exigua]|uniref:Uncharacterized protein n=1 Tax=Boeremia exigua TaxID=749465 RepID=A0ACC2HNI3_9PLEO|nr:hypothetical protein OPT61_g10718 [Boeremia exigua]
MVLVLVDRVMDCQRAGTEDECFLDLHERIPEWFGGWWHSERIRTQMQNGIAHARKWQDVEGWATLHDQEAARDDLLDGLPMETIDLQMIQQRNSDAKSDVSDTTATSADDVSVASPVGYEDAVEFVIFETGEYVKVSLEDGKEVIEILD